MLYFILIYDRCRLFIFSIYFSSQRSLSLKNLMSPTSNRREKHVDTPYKRPTPATPQQRRRDSQFWHQTVEHLDHYDSIQIKRQEAIYELFKGEMDLIDDLEMVKGVRDDEIVIGMKDDADMYCESQEICVRHSTCTYHKHHLKNLIHSKIG